MAFRDGNSSLCDLQWNPYSSSRCLLAFLESWEVEARQHSRANPNTIFAAKARHPLADRPLLDWTLILVMEPTTIVGAVLGAFINKVGD